MAIEPLKKKTMTLSELQLRTLDVLRKTMFQFNRRPYEAGMSDSEFIEQVLQPLETDIYQDRKMLKAIRKAKSVPAETEYRKALRTGVKPEIWPPITMTREDLDHFRSNNGA